jgi:hypothetical protein
MLEDSGVRVITSGHFDRMLPSSGWNCNPRRKLADLFGMLKLGSTRDSNLYHDRKVSVADCDAIHLHYRKCN